jgi:hypothetical protein
MRHFLLLMAICAFSSAYSQSPCPQNSILYKFYKSIPPRAFNEKLGNHPEFEFLQTINGITSVDLFLKSISNPENQTKYEREFKGFDLLLRNSGFTNGWRDLNASNIENLFVKPGTLGNLGFYDKVKDRISYIYVKLNPAGESPAGVAAWKLTNSAGCYLYILHTCGNAFYPNDKPTKTGGAVIGGTGKNSNNKNCCRNIGIETTIPPIELKTDSVVKPVHLTINYYEGRLVRARKSGSKSGYDTVFRLVRHRDTVTSIKDGDGRALRIYARKISDRIVVCKDTMVKFQHELSLDSAVLAPGKDSISLVFSDTLYLRDTVVRRTCQNKWEIALDGGISFNTIPKLAITAGHTQANGMHIAGEFALGKIINNWLIAGISASYIVLSYKDDVLYPGSVAGTYNIVYLGKPMIPVQLFGKATIGKQPGWQSTVSMSVGYSIQTNPKIESNGTTLTTVPDMKSGLTAGFKLGVAHFFTCKFGMGISFNWQYFSNTGSLVNYNPMALGITGGLKIQF